MMAAMGAVAVEDVIYKGSMTELAVEVTVGMAAAVKVELEC